jgi:5-formyltetrahydrofolate cyclo-ligase
MDKIQQRRLAYRARDRQPDKDGFSEVICRRIISLPWYSRARMVLWYAHCRSEVRTLAALVAELAVGKGVAVPYCTVDQTGDRCLGLWRLKSLDELRPGMWNILEPPRERWQEADRQILAEQLDAVVVPGVAFDIRGNRLGNGAGYYDRLLARLRSDAVLAGVCFESQLLADIVSQPHDVSMDYVVTERCIYANPDTVSK